MTNNEFTARRNVLKALILSNDTKELDKALKVKITKALISYEEVHKQITSEIAKYVNSIIPEAVKQLQIKPSEELSEEDKATIKEAGEKAEEGYNQFVQEFSQRECSYNDNLSFTEEEFEDIIDINAGKDFSINGHELSFDKYLSIFKTLFVK